MTFVADDGYHISTEERIALEQLARTPAGTSAFALRARIVLACAAGDTTAEVAQRLGVCRETVRKWRNRFAVHRLAGLADEPRRGAPRTIGTDLVHRVVVATLDLPPPTGERWTTRALAAATGVSQTTVSRIWREYGLRADRVRAWRLVTDPGFVAAVRGVVGVHLAGRESTLVLAVDHPDATGVAAPAAVMAPPALHSVAGPGPAGGASGPARRLIPFLAEVEAAVPDGTLHVLRADRPGAEARAVARWLARRRRFRHQVIPPCAPWPVLADRWLTAPGVRDHPGTAELRLLVRRCVGGAHQAGRMWRADPQRTEDGDGKSMLPCLP
ncbi:helix-turn-helix domain-containing protein [Micromonospora sp. WMMD735]|uniref:helix-turn-helix domain-containing protein n=1 Tax=Micromonospora sp. WMMD735 TaxID=3404130 RepID=UPI003B923EA2